MSVVPYGYANDVESVFDLNEDTTYGRMPLLVPPVPPLSVPFLYTFPDPLPIGSSKPYILKTGNPARSGRNQRYAVTVNVAISISTPQVTRNSIRIGIGGIGYNPPGGGIAVPGNGFPGFELNPTECGKAFPLSEWTSTGATDAILTVTGETTVKGESGIIMGIRFKNPDTSDTTQISIDSLTYQFRQVG